MTTIFTKKLRDKLLAEVNHKCERCGDPVTVKNKTCDWCLKRVRKPGLPPKGDHYVWEENGERTCWTCMDAWVEAGSPKNWIRAKEMARLTKRRRIHA